MSGLTVEELQFLESVLDLARSGATEELESALAAGVPVNLSSPAGDSLLILAAYYAHERAVEALLRRGADHRRVNDRGQTALGAATFRQNESIVAMLLDAGADPDLGQPSARGLAGFYDLPRMAALLDESRRPGEV